MHKILVIDDDPNMRRLIELYLNKENFVVDAVGSARSSVEKIRQGLYHLVITDLQMPDMDGLEFIRRIRAFNEEIPIVVTSAYSRGKIVNQALEAGASNVLEKPFDQQQLLKTLNEYLK